MRAALIIAASAFAMSTASPASAADILPKADARSVVMSAFSWTGCHAGLNLGGALTTAHVRFEPGGNFLTDAGGGIDVPVMRNVGSPDLRAAGFTGGAQLGCNYQAGSAIWGLESDFNALHTHATYFGTGTLPSTGHVVDSTVGVATDWLGTVRGRLGFAVDRVMLYATGGLAVGNVRFSQYFLHHDSGSYEAGSVSSAQIGWTVGGGLEYALTESLSVKAEYLYVDLGSVRFDSLNNAFPTHTAANSARFNESIVRIGANWKFYDPGPGHNEN